MHTATYRPWTPSPCIICDWHHYAISRNRSSHIRARAYHQGEQLLENDRDSRSGIQYRRRVMYIAYVRNTAHYDCYHSDFLTRWRASANFHTCGQILYPYVKILCQIETIITSKICRNVHMWRTFFRVIKLSLIYICAKSFYFQILIVNASDV